MKVMLTNTGLVDVPVSSMHGIAPWATLLYPQQPVAVGQEDITRVVVGVNPDFTGLPRKLQELGQWLQRALSGWRGRAADEKVTIAIENIGPGEIMVTQGDTGDPITLGEGALLQAAAVGSIIIEAVQGAIDEQARDPEPRS